MRYLNEVKLILLWHKTVLSVVLSWAYIFLFMGNCGDFMSVHFSQYITCFIHNKSHLPMLTAFFNTSKATSAHAALLFLLFLHSRFHHLALASCTPENDIGNIHSIIHSSIFHLNTSSVGLRGETVCMIYPHVPSLSQLWLIVSLRDMYCVVCFWIMKELCEKCATRRACQIEVLSACDVACLCGWCCCRKQGKPKKKCRGFRFRFW